MLLPLFPLELFLLPGEKITLHIFEPRYKQLVKDVLSYPDRSFAIPFFSIINTGNFASVVKITNAYNYNRLGECDIDITCEDVAIIQTFQQSQDINLYPTGEVLLSSLEKNAPLPLEFFSDYYGETFSVLDATKEKLTVLDFFQSMNPNVMDKLAFVSKRTNADREKYVLQFAKYFQNISEQESKVFESIYLN
jgi:hypothetical protein